MQSKILQVKEISSKLKRDLNNETLSHLKKNYLIEKISILEEFLKKERIEFTYRNLVPPFLAVPTLIDKKK